MELASTTDRIYQPTIGMELELLLADEKGYVSNIADNVIRDPRNGDIAQKEGRHCNLEINSSPQKTVRALHQEMAEKLLLLEEICCGTGAAPLSSSEFGAGKGKGRVRDGRTSAYEGAFGKDDADYLRSILGIHLHFAKHPTNGIGQYSLLLALDPLSYAITSTSPITEKGKNSLNNHRVNLVRNVVYKDLPLLAKLQKYPSTLEEFDERDEQRVQQWYEASGLDPETFFENHDKSSTGYHPIRSKRGERFGPTGTWEIRSFDSAPLNYSLPAVALYKGCNDHAMQNNIPIRVAEKDGEYSFSDEEIVLPNYRTLLQMQEEVIHYGLKSEIVKDYLTHVIGFAKKGLEGSEDQVYLERLEQIVESRLNPAALIMRHMREKGYKGHQFAPEQAADAILFARELHLEGLNYKPKVN